MGSSRRRGRPWLGGCGAWQRGGWLGVDGGGRCGGKTLLVCLMFVLVMDVQRRKEEGGVGAGGIIFSSREERMKGERFTYDTVDLPQHDTG